MSNFPEILRSWAIRSVWLQFQEKDAPKPVSVIAGARIRRPIAGKNVIHKPSQDQCSLGLQGFERL